jgi:hypothetical protein
MTLTRRELLRLTAAAAAAPLLPKGLAAAAGPEALPAGRFFGAAEMALLDELTETIIPADEHSGGARAARVAAFIDGKLAEFDPEIPDLREERERWQAGLTQIETLAREKLGKGFLEASAEERVSLLSPLAAAEDDPKTDAQGFFVALKEWTARGYYSSSIGIHDEIEYKGNTMQQEYAGIDVATLPPDRSGS